MGMETIQCVQLAQEPGLGKITIIKRGECMGTETFKEMEKEIFNAMCIAAQKLTKESLEKLDEDIASARDTKKYRLKAFKETSVKTVYGDVKYKRRMYIDDSGHARYLLDEMLETKQCGQYSENMVEKILLTATKES